MSADRLDLAAALALGSTAVVGLAILGLAVATAWRPHLPDEALEAAAVAPLSTGPAGRGALVPGGPHPAVPLDHVPGLPRVREVAP